MRRTPEPRLIRTYQPDRDRCVRALERLLAWAPETGGQPHPTPHPPPQDAAMRSEPRLPDRISTLTDVHADRSTTEQGGECV